MKTNSRLLQSAVDAFAGPPGIGRKTALRLAVYILQSDQKVREKMVSAVAELEQVCFCARCHNLSDQELCAICLDRSRDASIICVVENVQGIMAIEETGQYRGVYHILGGVISPIEGIGPENLNIESLRQRLLTIQPASCELIMAISPTIDGETTMYYLSKVLGQEDVRISQIARGVAFGGELQYTDELTLARAILSRIPYSMS